MRSIPASFALNPRSLRSLMSFYRFLPALILPLPCLAVMVLPGLLQWREGAAIAARGARTSGVVRRASEGRNGTVTYSFDVGDHAYEGTEGGSLGPAEGQTVEVYYDPSDPKRSTLDPESLVSRGQNLVGVGAFLSSMLAVVCLFMALRAPNQNPRGEYSP